MANQSSEILVSVLVIQLLCKLSNGIIIMDSGNPARFIRGSFMDVNHKQADFSKMSMESDFSQDKAFKALAKEPGFMQTLAGNIVEQLTLFNKEMSGAMIVEAKEVSARSALNMCQFSRARMSALQIMNILQSLVVRAASLGIAEGSTSAAFHVKEAVAMFKPAVKEVSTEFNQMEEDLRQYDVEKHGEAPMLSLAQAMKDFTVLQTSLALNE